MFAVTLIRQCAHSKPPKPVAKALATGLEH